MSNSMEFGGGGDDVDQRGLLSRATDIAAGLKHPVTAFFHLLFKVLALMAYIFGTWFSSSFVNIFVLCVLLLAFDFWTVKNVTGRLMVGLRWWSEVQDDGSTEWKFEAQEDNLQSTTLDIGVFWLGLIMPALIWFLFGIGSLFRLSFDWLLLISIALVLSFANIIGYVRCKKDARSKVATGVASFVTRAGMNNSMGRALTSAAGSAFGL
uniref:Golgi apparatus membrane protein TVP23 homolog n=1 Tax=Coccolithus braarudii TaxID=221442 RepID=A0A7S0Q2P4_9EUKA|mmetsp:Transcript_27880/g.60019  ORF Transcript_27880/g.60019 Transcript_27880/m.60019 type:complete len:209 (+) Transcript_27880:219-845(+)